MEPETLRDWGQRLRARRGTIPQTRLAELAGVDQSTISRVESGSLPVVSDKLKWKLAGALGCLVGDLFPYPNVKPPFPVEEAA